MFEYISIVYVYKFILSFVFLSYIFSSFIFIFIISKEFKESKSHLTKHIKKVRAKDIFLRNEIVILFFIFTIFSYFYLEKISQNWAYKSLNDSFVNHIFVSLYFVFAIGYYLIFSFRSIYYIILEAKKRKRQLKYYNTYNRIVSALDDFSKSYINPIGSVIEIILGKKSEGLLSGILKYIEIKRGKTKINKFINKKIKVVIKIAILKVTIFISIWYIVTK